jgi:hypothetical protein
MNAVFDFNRWLLYIGKHWNENKKKYLLSLGAIGGLLVLWYSFIMLINFRQPLKPDMQVITYYVGLFLTGCLFASFMFSDLNEGATGIHFLLVPVSALEKLLCALLFSGVLFFISYTLVYYVVDFSMVKISNSIIETAAKRDHFQAKVQEVINVFQAPPEMGDNFYIYFLILFVGVQSAFLLGSVYFVKFNFIKTTVSVLVLFVAFMFIVHKGMHLFMPPGNFFEPFSIYRVWQPDNTQVAILLPDWISDILFFLFKYSLAPVFWFATYFRLKEKEV